MDQVSITLPAMAAPGTQLNAFGVLIVTILTAVALSGCGGDKNRSTTPELEGDQTIAAADEVDVSQFPKADGKLTIPQLLAQTKAKRDIAMALGTQELVQGKSSRMAFGLFASENRKAIWGPTVVYVAKDSNAPARGPFPAPAISLEVPKRFQSETSNAEYGKEGNGIHIAEVKGFKGDASQEVLTLTNFNGSYHASEQELNFHNRAQTPSVGDKAPVIDNPTVADVGGEQNISKIDTRVPPDSMHTVKMADAIKAGRPVVLIFATPKHCVSRVCGPVVDIGEYIFSKYSDSADMIHQEIYNENDPNKGFVEQVGVYKLPTEPYTFVIDDRGRIAAKFEGPVTIPELEDAVREVTGAS